MNPSNLLSWKNEHCSEGFNTHLWGFQGHRWENIHFSTKPRHVTPQIDPLGKTIPVLRVSTHIYGVFDEIDGKTFIFRVNLGHVTSQIDCLGKMSTVMRVSMHIYGVSQEIDGETFIDLSFLFIEMKELCEGKRQNLK